MYWRIKDLTGKRFGKLTVAGLNSQKIRGGILWDCVCDCGGNKVVQSVCLKIGATKSCGCLKKGTFQDLIGKRFGRLVVLERSYEKNDPLKVWWNCKCDCGNFKVIRGNSLKTGSPTSCGCLRHEGVDLTWKRFGRLLVIGRSEKKDKSGRFMWFCKCDCGNYKAFKRNLLRYNQTRSCGCIVSKDLIGKRFGALRVVRLLKQREPKKKGGYKLWECVCDCGSYTVVNTNKLTQGYTKSCGCKRTKLCHIPIEQRRKEYNKRYYLKNREKRIAASKKWHEKHKDYKRQYYRKRKAIT